MEIPKDLWDRIIECLENADENYENSIIIKTNLNIIHNRLIKAGFKGD